MEPRNFEFFLQIDFSYSPAAYKVNRILMFPTQFLKAFSIILIFVSIVFILEWITISLIQGIRGYWQHPSSKSLECWKVDKAL